MDIDDIQSEIGDLRRMVEALDAALVCAESCETKADAIANVDEAIGHAEEVLRALRAIKDETASTTSSSV
jgi:hypothetical protein